jgi:hypothetical protein
MVIEFLQWLASLEREFIFLLALPFVVAVIGLWSSWVDREEIDREYEERAAQARERERREREHKDRSRGRSTHVPHHGLR